MKRNLILLVGTFLMTACAVQKTTYRESSARVIEPGLSVIVTPLIADLQVISQEKITPYVEVFPYEVTLFNLKYVDNFKRTALLNAAKKYNADVIVGAIIDVETTPKGEFQISVTGYPARWVNFRNATAADTWMVDMFQMTPGNSAAVLHSTEKKPIKIDK